MREDILKIINNSDIALSFQEIYDLMKLKTVDDYKNLAKEINSLEDELLVYRTNKNKYMKFQNSNLKVGKMLATKKGYGFVDIEGNEDVYIKEEAMNHAIHGDKVVVEITSKKGTSLEGRIVRIVERNLNNMVGEVVLKDGKYMVILDEQKVKLTIYLEPDHMNGAVEGSKVYIKITNKLKNNAYNADVLDVIGHKNDPGVDIKSVIYKYGINDVFSEEVKEELKHIPDKVLENEYEGRRDLRDDMIFTIDGDDTKDIDDAISIKKLPNGNYELGVHIADVSYYVKEGTALYNEAQDRGTSVYLADRVIPMLPHQLSNGICSLNPGVDRLAISCVMEIDKTGKTLSSDIFESVIRSRKQMTYKNVNKIIEDGVVPEGYEEFSDTLLAMKDLASILRKYKEKRGYIDFNIDESKIIVDEKGKAIAVVLRNRGLGEKMIEDFMIAANEAVATTIYFMDLPFIYRVHGEPSEEKIQKFLAFVSSLGYTVTGKIKEITPRTMQNILSQLSDKKEFHILSSLMLRSMQKAVYDMNNIGHFGLASEYYTHFTSPIRRFPDTTVHRLLRKYLFKHDLSKASIDMENRKLPYIAEHSSKKERDSIECEREVDDMKKAEYMMDHIGEKYTGMVNTVMSFGMFVELPNLIEGLVRVEDLVGDYYTFDESTMALIGKKNKRGYRLGDEVDIIVKAANKDLRTIDFVIDQKVKKLTK